MKLEFFGPSQRSMTHPAAASARLVNLYREPAGGRAGQILKSTLGLSPAISINRGPVRAMHRVRDLIYIAAGARLWSVAADLSISEIGPIADDANTTISANGESVTVCAAGRYWVWDGSILMEPTPGEFTVFQSVDYISGYTVLTEADGQKICWSDPFDAKALPALNFDTAAASDDRILRTIVFAGNLWVLKERSMEAFYVTGQPGALALDRVQGSAMDRGLLAFGLVCPIPTGAFAVASDGRAWLVGAGAVSFPPVEAAIKNCRPVSCLYYEDEGHGFCCITFRDCPAWCYDLLTGEWHERASGSGPWSVVTSVQHGSDWLAGRLMGDVMRFERSNRDGADPLIRTAISPTMENDGARFSLAEVEVFARTGDADAAISMAISGDHGRTFGRERIRQLPPVGRYDQRLIWRALGQHRQACVRISTAAPVDIAIDATGRVRTA